jgi:hypothetical protein
LNKRSIFPNDLLGLAALVVEISALIAADAIGRVIDWAWEE